MSETSHAQLLNVPPLKVGDVFAKEGSSHIFRVVGERNWVERFTGNRKERRAKLAEWRAATCG